MIRILSIAAACVALAHQAQAADFKLAFLHSLTGAPAFAGLPLLKGAQLAIEDLNREQFLGAGNSISYVIGDDAGDRTQTVTLLNQYAANSNILAVFGPTSTSAAIAGLAVSAEKQLPTLSSSASLEALKSGGSWGRILTEPSVVALPTIAQFAVEKLQVRSCAVVNLVDVEAFVTAKNYFVDYVSAKGVKIAAQEGFKVADSDFSALATKVANLPDIDCVFVSAFAPQGANVVRQLRQAGLDPAVRIMGQNGFASPDFIEKGGSAVEGVYLIGDWVPGGASPKAHEFVAAYKTKYGNDPDNWAAMGYAAVQVLATAIKNAEPTPTRGSINASLAASKNVPVIVGEGTFSFDDKGYPHYGNLVLVVKDGKFRVPE